MGLFDILGALGSTAAAMYDADLQYKAAQESNAIADRQNQINYETLQWNKQNASDVLNWNKEQFNRTDAYNRWLNQTQMQREDNAIQRRMADLKAAGLSPLLAAGDAASASAGSSLTAPELNAAEMSGVNFSGHQPMQLGLQDKWNSTIQAMQEFNVMAKTDAEKSLISSQNTSQNLQNSEFIQTMKYNSQNRIIMATQNIANINKTIQEIENMKKTGNLTQEQIEDMGLQKQIDELKIVAQTLTNDINQEVKRQNEIKTKIDEHDANVIMAGPLTSSVVNQGAQTSVGKAAQDIAYGVHTANSNKANSNLYDEYSGNNNISPNKEIEKLPPIGELTRGEGYQDDGFYKNEGKKVFYYAGRGVAYSSTGDIYYGRRRIKPDEFEAAMNMIENTGSCLNEYLYPEEE